MAWQDRKCVVQGKWVGLGGGGLQLRQTHKMNIIGYRSKYTNILEIQLTPDYIFNEDEWVIAVTDNKTIDNFEEYTNKM